MYLAELNRHNIIIAFAYFKNFFDRITAILAFKSGKDKRKGKHPHFNTYYKENYNVPFIVYDKQLKHKTIKGYLATKDIPATLLDLANIKIPTYFKGKSLLNFEGRDFATVEYMGGGCPDLKRRPIILGIRNKNYEVIVEAFNNQFDIKEVYDIKEDLYEQKNLYKNRHLNLKNELEFIQKRYDEIISDSKGE